MLLSGCQNLVKNALLHATSYPHDAATTNMIKTEFDIQTRQFCDPIYGCYDYLFAANKANKKRLKMNNAANFTDKEHKTSLLIERKNIPGFSGSVVLIHGFRGSKEWMALSAAYFQFLGFDVYLLDLMGHGDYSVSKGFGVNDVDYIASFIQHNLDASLPIIAVGNSMGGLVASYLASQKHVDLAILQAPMTQFDEGLRGHLQERQPWYRFLLTDNTINKGAAKALSEVGISNSQTNSIVLLKQTPTPILIFASNTDSVSPYSAFEGLSSPLIEVVKVEDVEHAYMSMIGQGEHNKITRWLSSKLLGNSL